MAIIRERLNERAQQQDEELMRSRLIKLFGEEATERIVMRPFEMLNAKTPSEVIREGTAEERYELEVFITFAETPPWCAGC